MPGVSGGKGGSKGGSNGASNAALNDDEDAMNRRRVNFSGWKATQQGKAKHPKHLIDYANSPAPPKR